MNQSKKILVDLSIIEYKIYASMPINLETRFKFDQYLKAGLQNLVPHPKPDYNKSIHADSYKSIGEVSKILNSN